MIWMQFSEPDMRYSGDAYFDEKNLMDIQVMSTMGLTEDDLDAILRAGYEIFRRCIFR